MIAQLRQEDGATVVIVLLVTLVGLLLSAALVARAASTEGSVRRDAESRRSLQAAQAGLQRALWQATALSGATASSSTPCATVDASGQYVAVPVSRSVGGVAWCGDQTEQLGAGQTVTYAFSGDRDPRATTITKDIVATGVVDGVQRRVHQQVTGYDIAALFGDYTVVSLQDIHLRNNTQIGSNQIAGNVRTNGSVRIEGGAEICGSVTWGDQDTDTLSVTNGGNVCQGYDRIGNGAATPPREVPDIDLPVPVLPQSNDNANICAPGTCTTPSWISWNATARSLSLTNSADVTVRGNVFVLCRLYLTNSASLTFDPIDRTRPVRIYFDSPERCGGQTEPVRLDNNVTFRTTVDGDASTPPMHLYALGSPSVATSLTFTNRNIPRAVQIYAPQSEVKMDNHGVFTGGVAAKQVTIDNHIEIYAPSNPSRLELGTGIEFERGPFTECTPSSTSGQTLSAGC